MEICNIKIPKSTCVHPNLYAVHHDPKVWKDPEQFNPDRWHNLGLEQAKSYFPFSAAPRDCLGQKFAMNTLILTVSMILFEYDVFEKQNQEVGMLWEGVLHLSGFEICFRRRKL